jgi:uncharacterized protein DUF3606
VAKKSSRSRAQDRRQAYEVRYESKKTGRSSARKKVGPSRKKIERELGS